MSRDQRAFEEAFPEFQGATLTPGSRLPSYIKGHRKRLRERFQQGGPNAMPDYELLELILFGAIPQGDVKPLARRLIDYFGDFNRTLSATEEQLVAVKGVGPTVALHLKLVAAAAERLAQSRVLHQPVISSWAALVDYCHVSMAHRDIEQFRVLFLDRKNNLIADEEQARGTVDHVPVYPREIMKRALMLNATAIILVHNHPSGDPTPSEADITMTDQIVAAGHAMDVLVHDHLIIGKSSETSFRTEGLL